MGTFFPVFTLPRPAMAKYFTQVVIMPTLTFFFAKLVIALAILAGRSVNRSGNRLRVFEGRSPSRIRGVRGGAKPPRVALLFFFSFRVAINCTSFFFYEHGPWQKRRTLQGLFNTRPLDPIQAKKNKGPLGPLKKSLRSGIHARNPPKWSATPYISCPEKSKMGGFAAHFGRFWA